LAAGAVALSLLALFAPSLNLVASLGRDSTLTGRTTIWAGALSVVTHPLLGTGFESFWEGARLTKIWAAINEPGIQEAHNGYLEVFLNLGWVGVLLLAALIVTGYKNVTHAMRRDPRSGGVRIAMWLVVINYALTEAGFRMMSMTWISFLLVTAAVPQFRMKNAPSAWRAVTLDEKEPAMEVGARHNALKTI
jgi:O-antigen ligase